MRVTRFLLLRAMQGMELRHRLCVRIRIGNAFVGSKGEYFLHRIENRCRFGRAIHTEQMRSWFVTL